jgi:hypothetical protein
MRRVIRCKGIKLLDEQVEAAAFRILIGVYAHLVTIQDHDDLDEVLFVFKEYIYKEYQYIHPCLIHTKHNDTSNFIKNRIEHFKNKELLIPPSEILGEFDNIKNIKKQIQVQGIRCFPCIKLKYTAN